MMQILFLSRWFPFPPTNGSKLRIYHLLRGLAQRNKVSLISYYSDKEGISVNGALRGICDPIHVIPYKGFDPGNSKIPLDLLRITPRSVLDTYSVQVESLIRKELQQKKYDLVIASQFDMAVYAKAVAGMPAIFEEVETGFYYDRANNGYSKLKRFRHKLTWLKHRTYLGKLLDSYRACTVVSEKESLILQRDVSRAIDIKIIPNCIDLNSYTDYHRDPQPNSLIFTGSLKFAPNYEAMCWFIQEVFPIVQSHIPAARLTITGDSGGKQLPRASNVHLSGFVPDIRRMVASASVSLAPILNGGGTRLKILEAMALRSPVVATSKGAEGLDGIHGEHLLIADDPHSYAAAVIDLLKDTHLNRRISDNAFQLVKSNYDWAVVMPRFLELVESVV